MIGTYKLDTEVADALQEVGSKSQEPVYSTPKWLSRAAGILHSHQRFPEVPCS